MRLIKNKRKGATFGVVKRDARARQLSAQSRAVSNRAKAAELAKASWGESERLNQINFLRDLRKKGENPFSLLKRFNQMGEIEKLYILRAMEAIGYRIPRTAQIQVDLENPQNKKTFITGVRELLGEIDQLK